MKLIIPAEYLQSYKLLIRYQFDDMDPVLNDNLVTSTQNVLTQYMNIPEEKFSGEIIDPKIIDIINNDKRFKSAVLHIAVTLFQNPDQIIVSLNGSVINNDQIINILGNLVSYWSIGEGVIWKK